MTEVCSEKEGFAAQDKQMEEKFVAQEIRILAAVDKRLEKMEERLAKSLDALTKEFLQPGLGDWA